MPSFRAKLEIIGINPFVFVPPKILEGIFTLTGTDKGPIPVCGTVNKKKYKQTLVRYKGEWRLYINTTILPRSPKRIGEEIMVSIQYDPEDRTVRPHPLLIKALNKNKTAKAAFNTLTQSRQKEIARYLSFLKSEQTVIKNIEKVIGHLTAKNRDAGRNQV